MDKEEQAFPSAARRSLSEADFADIEGRLSQREDPLFRSRQSIGQSPPP